MEQQIENKPDEGFQRLFKDVAQGQNEIDWFGLKKILESAMSPKRSYFRMLIASFSKFIRDFFVIRVSPSSSKDNKNGDVFFFQRINAGA